MKYVSGEPTATLELTRRNLQALLDKLDDPYSARTLVKQEDEGVGDSFIRVTAVEDDEHYADRRPGEVYMPATRETR